jgi:hypothetical protein
VERVRDYELKAFFTTVIEVLERLEIPYMVVGGFAAILYGQPRLTIDVDVVVEMEPRHVDPFVAAFPIPDYYVSEEAVRDSLRRRYLFHGSAPAASSSRPRARRLIWSPCLGTGSPGRPFTAARAWRMTRKGTRRRS